MPDYERTVVVTENLGPIVFDDYELVIEGGGVEIYQESPHSPVVIVKQNEVYKLHQITGPPDGQGLSPYDIRGMMLKIYMSATGQEEGEFLNENVKIEPLDLRILF